MTTDVTLAPGESRAFDVPVETVKVSKGSAIVAVGDELAVVPKGKTHDASGVSGLRLYAAVNDGEVSAVVKTDVPPAPKPSKGDLSYVLNQAKEHLAQVEARGEDSGVVEAAEAAVRTAEDRLEECYPKGAH